MGSRGSKNADLRCFAHVIDLGLMGPRGACNLGGTPGYMAPDAWLEAVRTKRWTQWDFLGVKPCHELVDRGAVDRVIESSRSK